MERFPRRAEPPEDAGLGGRAQRTSKVQARLLIAPMAPRPLLSRMMKNITFQKSATRI